MSNETATHLLADRYQIGEQLGRGGMAEVHAGYDTRLGRPVAVKLLRPALANDPAFRTRFRQEAQAAAKMAHPTIVRVYDAGEQTVRDAAGQEIQLPFIVMERVDGTLLKDLVAKGPVPTAEAVRIVDGILTALEYSHRAGVVHRDIKPGNVMVTASGQVKVMDFGIARAISDSAASVAQTSAILGTAQYFSPEQAKGEQVDSRTDLYSAGVVLYELLTGRPPFQGESPVAVAYAHVSETPVPPRQYVPAIPPALEAVVLRSLAKDRFQRFQSAEEFRQALGAAVAGGQAPAAAAAADSFTATLFGVSPTSAAAQQATMRRLSQSSDERTVRTQNRPPVAWIWAGILGAIVIVGATLYWVFSLTPGNFGGSASVAVPNVTGQPYDQGGQTLLNSNLQVNRSETTDATVPEGSIVQTIPDSGTSVAPGTTVTVVVSTGAPLVTLPSLTFKNQSDATETIESLGLVVGSVTKADSPNVPKGQVLGITVAGGTLTSGTTQVPAGSTVDLQISTGKVDIPNFVGKTVQAAQSGLQSLQLGVELVQDPTCSGQKVTSQSLKGEQAQKSKVTITWCSATS